MENRGYIRIFKLSRLAFLPKSASECDSQQRAAMFDYADEDAQDQRAPDLTAGLTPLTCAAELGAFAPPFDLKRGINGSARLRRADAIA